MTANGLGCIRLLLIGALVLTGGVHGCGEGTLPSPTPDTAAVDSAEADAPEGLDTSSTDILVEDLQAEDASTQDTALPELPVYDSCGDSKVGKYEECDLSLIHISEPTRPY